MERIVKFKNPVQYQLIREAVKNCVENFIPSSDFPERIKNLWSLHLKEAIAEGRRYMWRRIEDTPDGYHPIEFMKPTLCSIGYIYLNDKQKSYSVLASWLPDSHEITSLFLETYFVSKRKTTKKEHKQQLKQLTLIAQNIKSFIEGR